MKGSLLWIALVACPCVITGQTGETASRNLELNGNATQILTKAFAGYGIQVLFPSRLPNGAAYHLDLRDIDLSNLGRALGPLTGTFFAPVDAHTVFALPDDHEHRSRYEHAVTETIEVPNLDKSSVTNLLTTLFAIRNLIVHDDTVTIQATPQIVWEARQTLAHLYRPKGQVLLRVKTYLVSRSHSRDAGLELPQSVTVFNLLTEAQSLIRSNESVVEQLIASGVVSAADTLGIAELLIAGGYASGSLLGSSSLYFGGGDTAFGVQFDSVNANAALSVSSVEELQDASLRLGDGQTGTLLLGEKYPILTSTYSALGTTSSAATTPGISYQDLGLKLEAITRLLSSRELLIHLHGTIRSVGSGSLNNIPILDNQEFSSDLSVPAGVTTVMVTSLSQSEARALQGLADHVITDSSRKDTQFSLAVTVTPVVTSEAALPPAN
jgi:general secretion pathway protein D